jgi:outer membrane protein OmpA-like peptidoglycan-associated protein
MKKELILIKILCSISFLFQISFCKTEKENGKLSLEHYTFQPIYFGNWLPSLKNPTTLKNDIIIAKELLKKHPKSVLLVIGHAGTVYRKFESKKSEEDAFKISKDRAEAIKRELIRLGVSKDRIITKAIGSKSAQITPKLFESYNDFQERAQTDRKADIFFVEDPKQINDFIKTKLN